MNIELLIGRWLLTGSISLNSQIKFIGDEPWLDYSPAISRAISILAASTRTISTGFSPR
jgi:hypothetical protein